MEKEWDEENLLPHRLVLCQGEASNLPHDESVLGVGPPSTPNVHRELFVEEGLGIHEHLHQGSVVLPWPVYNWAGRLPGKLLLCGGADSLMSTDTELAIDPWRSTKPMYRWSGVA